MKQLEQAILAKGRVLKGDILKVDGFLNHQLDVDLINEIGKDIAGYFADRGVTKVLTLEASGIAIASFAAFNLKVPALFAKKNKTANLPADVYSTSVMSYTHGRSYDIFVSKDFLTPNDKVLIVDDFLANGQAVNGLMALANLAGAEVVGVAIAIEKGFSAGGRELRARGVDLHSLAIVESMDEESIVLKQTL